MSWDIVNESWHNLGLEHKPCTVCLVYSSFSHSSPSCVHPIKPDDAISPHYSLPYPHSTIYNLTGCHKTKQTHSTNSIGYDRDY